MTTPIVFVVYDDESVRASLKSLIEAAGWQAETFASAQEFLCRPRAFVPGCLILYTSVQAMKAGAMEFLTKPYGDSVLLDAITHAIERSRQVLVHEAKMQALRESYASLTPREREVMGLVASGLLNKQVGGELGISEITVKAHRGQVMRKMKANSLPVLVHMVAWLGLEMPAFG
jgi:FixJ family two-component response regulator